eukprot:m.79001 g.79001  ORF g.79001 m.79001 type:complete len:1118 (+) comp8174_c0_seq3:512-3865(+)
MRSLAVLLLLSLASTARADVTVNLFFQGLTEVPVVPANTTHLNLAVNAIGSLANTSFAGLPELVHLDMSVNSLTTIHTHYFQGLSALRTLNLQNNRIHTIMSGAFSGLAQLSVLDLGRNALAEVPSNAFAGVHALIHRIVLTGNRMTSIGHAVFAHLDLHELVLDSNRLVSLGGALANLTRLQTLSVEQNRLTSVLAEETASLTDLESISLANNKISILEENAFSHSPLLHSIVLHSNLIPAIERDHFAGLFNLTSLVLFNNQLSMIANESFRDLAELISLDLSINKLTADGLPENVFSALQKLNTLNFRLNRLGSLRSTLLTGLASLEFVNFENNELFSVDDGAFDDLPVLARLRLGFNFLTSLSTNWFGKSSHVSDLNLEVNDIDAVDWDILTHLDHLHTLTLKRNRIGDLPLGIFRGASIHTLDLSSNLIDRLEPRQFAGFDVSLLSLDFNNITEISPLALDDFDATSLSIFGNPDVSCCGLHDIRDQYPLLASSIYCLGPNGLASERLSSTSGSLNAAECNACVVFPCLGANEISCSRDRNRTTGGFADGSTAAGRTCSCTYTFRYSRTTFLCRPGAVVSRNETFFDHSGTAVNDHVFVDAHQGAPLRVVPSDVFRLVLQSTASATNVSRYALELQPEYNGTESRLVAQIYVDGEDQSDWQAVAVQIQPEANGDSSSGSMSIIIVAVVVAMVLLLAVIVAMAVRRRRKPVPHTLPTVGLEMVDRRQFVENILIEERERRRQEQAAAAEAGAAASVAPFPLEPINWNAGHYTLQHSGNSSSSLDGDTTHKAWDTGAYNIDSAEDRYGAYNTVVKTPRTRTVLDNLYVSDSSGSDGSVSSNGSSMYDKPVFQPRPTLVRGVSGVTAASAQAAAAPYAATSISSDASNYEVPRLQLAASVPSAPAAQYGLLSHHRRVHPAGSAPAGPAPAVPTTEYSVAIDPAYAEPTEAASGVYSSVIDTEYSEASPVSTLQPVPEYSVASAARPELEARVLPGYDVAQMHVSAPSYELAAAGSSVGPHPVYHVASAPGSGLSGPDESESEVDAATLEVRPQPAGSKPPAIKLYASRNEFLPSSSRTDGDGRRSSESSDVDDDAYDEPYEENGEEFGFGAAGVAI